MQNDDDLRALAKIMAFMRSKYSYSTNAPLLVLLWLFPRRKVDISCSR